MAAEQGCQFGFFKPDFEIVAFFQRTWLFLVFRQNLAFF